MARPGTFTSAIVDASELNALGAVYTSGTRPTGADVYEGLHIWETNTDRWMMYDGTGWIIMSEPVVSFSAFTMTGITVGNGTKSGNYHRSDGWCDFVCQFQLGTTSAVTGDVVLTLPVQAAANPNSSLFRAYFLDSGAAELPAMIAAASTTTIAIRAINTAGTYATQATCSATVPMTWATGDIIYISGRYPMTTRYS